MTITLTSEELDEIWEQESLYQGNPDLEVDEQLRKIPNLLGEGYAREIEICSGFYLRLLDYEYSDNLLVKSPIQEHNLHFEVLLAGKIIDNDGQIGEGSTLICGGGIQNKIISETKKGQRVVRVSIHIPHELFANFFAGESEETNSWLQKLVTEDDWQIRLFPKTNPAIQGVAQQILNCPFQGAIRKIYLQGKTLELISLQLATFLENRGKKQISSRLKPDTIARVHQAKDILHCRLQNPPSLLELGEIVGISDRTLRRGFRELFGTTVFNYSLQKRMEKAENLLREGNYSVAEVANFVGYSHLGLFASAFKRQYGISPRECILGKKSVSGY